MTFDRVLIVDWSGGNDRGPTPKPDAIWTAEATRNEAGAPRYHRNRQVAEAWLSDRIAASIDAGERLFVGFDFPFGFPTGFAEGLTGSTDPFAVWDWLAARIEDAPKTNNRFDVAAAINGLFPGTGPFWANALRRDIPGLPRTDTRQGHGLPERRQVERVARGAFPCWQLAGAGAVGSQSLMGLPVLARLRRQFRDAVAVWPFETLDRPVAFVEVWPSLLRDQVRRALDKDGGIKDAHQVAIMARAIAALEPGTLAAILDVDAPEEGWIFGLGHESALDAAALAPPPLRDDCFALPRGAVWTPVEDALSHLRAHLAPVCGEERAPLHDADGRILSASVTALRSHPPAPNSAVDGYGFAHRSLPPAPHRLPLVGGRAAAGRPFEGNVPPGRAIRILTGAALPEGVDTVVLEEDCAVGNGAIAFDGPVRRGANCRAEGEDIVAGMPLFDAGRRLDPADLATLAAAGLATLPVRRALRVGVLSTGDEIRDPGADVTAPPLTFDANRPMLKAICARWGCEVHDLGRAEDRSGAVRDALDRGARDCDVILSSGGASAGDEDHVSRLLGETGSFALWRIAIKPGRPLALGLWGGVPVFGLPGNPVAAFVCTLIFARPALSLLAGGPWITPDHRTVPAAFSKSKKAGRREYLRARLVDGRAEVFPSEGSGRVSGLSWAEGLVELDEPARDIRPGDPVRYLPFSGFGL